MKRIICLSIFVIIVFSNCVFATSFNNLGDIPEEAIQYEGTVSNSKQKAYNIAKDYLNVALSLGINYIRRPKMQELLEYYEGISRVDASYGVNVAFDEAGIVDGEFPTLYIEDALIVLTYKGLKNLPTSSFKELNVSGIDIIKNAIGLNDKKKIREELALKYAKMHFDNFYYISKNSLIKILKSYGWSDKEAEVATLSCGDWKEKAIKFATLIKLQNPDYKEKELTEYLKGYKYTDSEASEAARHVMNGELSNINVLTDNQIIQAFISNGFTPYEGEYFLEKTREIGNDVIEVQFGNKKNEISSNEYIITKPKTDDNSETIEYIKSIVESEHCSMQVLIDKISEKFDKDVNEIRQVIMFLNIDFYNVAFEKVKMLISNGEKREWFLKDELYRDKFLENEVDYAIVKAKENKLID